MTSSVNIISRLRLICLIFHLVIVSFFSKADSSHHLQTKLQACLIICKTKDLHSVLKRRNDESGDSHACSTCFLDHFAAFFIDTKLFMNEENTSVQICVKARADHKSSHY